MPSPLRRSRRREFSLTRSFMNAIQDKVHLEPVPYTDGILVDRINRRPHVAFAPTSEAANDHALTSRPSMILSLHHSPNPDLPVHPIHLLPPELLVHVFTLGCLDAVMFPVLVSHVCHSWRAITLHAHSLWRRVLLDPNSRLPMWKERIRRARLCTLDVILCSDSYSKASSDIDTIALQMHFLAPHLPALRSLHVRFDSYAPYLWNAALGPLCRPNSYLWDHKPVAPGNQMSNDAIETMKLESLILHYPRNDDAKEFTLFGGFAPRLTRLTLNGVRLTWLPELFGNLAYLDYTHHGFSSGHVAIKDILGMLQVSSRIRELRLCFPQKNTESQVLHLQSPRFVDHAVTLPSLEFLSLRVDNVQMDVPSELICIASRLSVPILKTVWLQDRCVQAPWGGTTDLLQHYLRSLTNCGAGCATRPWET
ncbi:hypothetical protein PAXRUDRAFT_597170 [Paxillus rubicundulus Ve08.2h10]|uniref:F-box domain-containing protein n=1 Tax=Paxillus rubicundulus Ve08.2h10 TaxID=930991 RepID=A0A0D0DZ16_9AGAM|nr:hypothetical protein PAXRUDRAFT_597170 [Paxillus rubicundulus Ve08.2h10]